jgi:hypothetical protein
LRLLLLSADSFAAVGNKRASFRFRGGHASKKRRCHVE